jgi:superfamily I DNA and RNA helicase
VVEFLDKKMQNNTLAAAAETLQRSHLREEKMQEKLSKIRQRLMRKIRSGKAKITQEKTRGKHLAAARDLQILTEIKKSIDALKQNIKKAE